MRQILANRWGWRGRRLIGSTRGKQCGQIDPFFLRLNTEMVSSYSEHDVGTGGEAIRELVNELLSLSIIGD